MNNTILAATFIVPFIGLQAGGQVDVRNLRTPVDSAPSLGVFVEFDQGHGRMLDFEISGQQTQAVRNDPYVDPASADVDVIYGQFGGRVIIHPELRTSSYLGMTLGLTYISANSEHAVQPSGAFAGGFIIKMTPRTSLVLDARYRVTVFVNSGAIACDSSGICAGSTSGSIFPQLTLSTGVAFRF